MLEKFTTNSMTLCVPTMNHALLLMDIAEHLNCTIQKYFWSSKYDREIVEEVEPKIPSAYNTVVEIHGALENLNGALEVFRMKRENLNGLSDVTVQMSEDEIKDCATKMLNLC